jgi:hypothetical protein
MFSSSKTSRIVTAGLGLAVTGGLVLGVAGPASAATTGQADGSGAAQAGGLGAVWDGFTVIDETATPMTQVSHNSDGGDWRVTPQDGTVLQPGTSQWFAKDWRFVGSDEGYVTYRMATGQSVTLEVSPGAHTADARIGEVGPVTDFDTSYQVVTDGSVAIITDASAQTHDLDAANPAQAQAAEAVFQAFYHANPQWTQGTFTPDSSTYQHDVLSPKVEVSPVVASNGQSSGTQTLTTSTSVAVTTSWSATASLGFGAGPIAASFSATYGKAYQTQTTVSYAIEENIPAGQEGWIDAQYPVDQVTGNYTITIGNETWNLANVTVQDPLQLGGQYFVHYTLETQPLSQ